MAGAVPKLAFDNGGAFIRDTRAEVEAYLARGSTRLRGALVLYAKAPIALALTAVSWSVLIFAQPGVIVGLLCLVGLVLGAMLTAFCVQHDANHGSYFKQRRWNHLVGWSTDSLLGFSSYAWRVKHNVAHHTYTNVDGYDDDATQVPLARFAPSQPTRPWYRFQQYYIWPMYTLMGLRWQTVGDLHAFRRGTVGESTLKRPRGWTLFGVIAGKAFFITWAIVIPLLVYPWWGVLAAYVFFTMITSLIMATTFQLAHCVEEASFASADELRTERRIWAVHEVETTVDFCPRNPVLTWMLGGLNFQIEHHLFPKVPHTHYPKIAEIVRRNCLKHDVRYSFHPSLGRALRSHFLHLREMGRLGLPPEIEMG
ncbi:acyl-CoA desaturase [Gaiella sp.]|uniref:fatty acid desaturase family protein n=2 Tax=Gaiella sp. TaxID=2663207 RepID=UPI003266EE73